MNFQLPFNIQYFYLIRILNIFIFNTLKMRKDQAELIQALQNNEKVQFYLLEAPTTPQQQFLHLFAHKNLVKNNIFHYNLDKVINLLQGSFISNILQLKFIETKIEHNIQVTEASPLLNLIEGWVNYYPTIKANEKLLLNSIILQNSLQYEGIKSYELFLSYLNIISPDIWKILRNTRSPNQFLAQKSFKDDMKEVFELSLKRFDIEDMLIFVNGCLPKSIMLNIILEQDNIPYELRQKYKRFQCLFSNQNIEYFLKKCNKLTMLIRQIMLILIATNLNKNQQKNLVLIAMKYYIAYHHEKKYSAPEVFIYSFNKLEEDVKKELTDNFYLFFKMLKKIGKNKFISFLQNNSPYLKTVVEFINKNPVVGYSINAVSPFNSFDIAQKVLVMRGSSQVRTFQVLEQLSIVYLKIKATTLDITIRLSYLGQIESQTQENIKLLTIQKVQEYSSSIIATKRGLYMLEFDNTFSWINNKEVSYDIVICSPLSMKSLQFDEWTTQYYDNCVFNELANEKQIVFIQNKKVDKKKKNIKAKANLLRLGQLFSLGLNNPQKGQEYVYETDNSERMKQKVQEILQSKKNQYLWTIQNQSIKNEDQLIDFIENESQIEYQLVNETILSHRSQKESPKQKKKEILAKYQQSDDEGQTKSKQQTSEKSSLKNLRNAGSQKLKNSQNVEQSTENNQKNEDVQEKVVAKPKNQIFQAYQQN